MSKQYEWAKDYIERFDKAYPSATRVGGLELELYNLAQAIVADKEMG